MAAGSRPADHQSLPPDSAVVPLHPLQLVVVLPRVSRAHPLCRPGFLYACPANPGFSEQVLVGDLFRAVVDFASTIVTEACATHKSSSGSGSEAEFVDTI